VPDVLNDKGAIQQEGEEQAHVKCVPGQ
jgi:hypothetical protein